jgi:hypothetical protein
MQVLSIKIYSASALDILSPSSLSSVSLLVTVSTTISTHRLLVEQTPFFFGRKDMRLFADLGEAPAAATEEARTRRFVFPLTLSFAFALVMLFLLVLVI